MRVNIEPPFQRHLRGGVAKLADIGLVTSVDATRSFVGTKAYVPPEGAGTPADQLWREHFLVEPNTPPITLPA
jgi:hypothetical protein